MFSIFEDATAKEIREAMEFSAQGTGQCGNDEKYGHGHVDAKAAADLLQSKTTPPASCKPTVVRIKPDNYGGETTWQITNPDGVPIAGGGPYEDGRTTTRATALDLPELPLNQCYTFTIYDSASDG